ncbi:hypothetical protein Pd630_LPD11064 (plasmid) [Rhodococcus opacus PD630]|nr:hypothetical protein Pd630_LPD11064 [Rhodococcus opacus PD630]
MGVFVSAYGQFFMSADEQKWTLCHEYVSWRVNFAPSSY